MLRSNMQYPNVNYIAKFCDFLTFFQVSSTTRKTGVRSVARTPAHMKYILFSTAFR